MTKSYFNHIMVRLILLSHRVNKTISCNSTDTLNVSKKIPLISLIYTEAIRANQCQSVGNLCPFKSTYQLLIVNCQLLTVNCQLLTVNC